MKILLVEDEEYIAIPLKKSLSKQGYLVEYVNDGAKALEMLRINTYSCVVLDINLPSVDGLKICNTIRKEKSDVPILMLTARGSIDDKIIGLKSGADDYLTKPFNLQELLLRVARLIQRYCAVQDVHLAAHGIELNADSFEVKKDKTNVILNRKEFAILEYLMRNANRFISQEELLERIWHSDTDMFTNTVRTQILNLRKKIDPHKELILTKKGVGYKFKK